MDIADLGAASEWCSCHTAISILEFLVKKNIFPFLQPSYSLELCTISTSSLSWIKAEGYHYGTVENKNIITNELSTYTYISVYIVLPVQ